MGDTFNLGNQPLPMSVTLIRGGDFVTSLVRTDGDDWPDTAGAHLDFDDDDATSWVATVAGPAISWAVDKVDVAALIERSPQNARLFYIDGDTDLVWGVGTVIRA